MSWGDGYCREPKEGEESEATRLLNFRLEDESQQKIRKRVLQKLNTLFGGSDDGDLACSLDRVTDMEMFFLISMYFSFPRGEGGPGKCFGSGKHVWESDLLRSKSDYCVRSFLAKSAGIQTVVLIPTEFGVVELGSVKPMVENPEMLKALKLAFCPPSPLVRPKPVPAIVPIVTQKKDESVPYVPSPSLQMRFSDRVEEAPKIFGQNLNTTVRPQFREKLAVRKMEDRRWDHYSNGNKLSFTNQNPRNGGVHVSSWTNIAGVVKPPEVFSPQNNARIQGYAIGVQNNNNYRHSHNQYNQQKPAQMQIDFTGATSRPAVESEHSDAEDDRLHRKRGRKPANGRDRKSVV